MDVHKGGPAHVDACGQGEGVKNVIFCGRHKWMAPYIDLFIRGKSPGGMFGGGKCPDTILNM